MAETLCKVKIGGRITVEDKDTGKYRKVFVKDICRASLSKDGRTWDIKPYSMPPKLDVIDWEFETDMASLVFLDWSSRVNKYTDGKHGIKPKHLDGLKPQDSFCAIRRATRDLPHVTILKDVPIRFCIQWGILPAGLPKRWPDNQPAVYK